MLYHGRFDYRAITDRDTHRWPQGATLTVYIGLDLEHHAFGEGCWVGIAPPAPGGEPDVLNYTWRESGNRVGARRCLELLGVIANTSLLDAFHVRCDALSAMACHIREIISALVFRGPLVIRLVG